MTSNDSAHAAVESLYVAATPVLDSGTVRLAGEAASACVAAAAMGIDEIGTLIFAGTYRTRMMSEPAVAAIVAGELGAGLGGDRVLAFDIIDGPASTLRAWFVAAQLLRAGRTRSVLVVSAESPGTSGLRLPAGHGVEASAAACLLSRRCCDDPASTVPIIGDFSESPAGLDPRSVSALAGCDGSMSVAEGEARPGTADDPTSTDLPYGTAVAYALARAASPAGWRQGLATAALPGSSDPVVMRERSGLGWLSARFGDLPAHAALAAAPMSDRPSAPVPSR